MGRPRKSLPANGLDIIRGLAAHGANEVQIAGALGLDFRTWKRLLDDDPEARAAWQEARAIEENKLRRHVFAAAPWVPYLEASSGRMFINCPSTYRDNPHIDRAEYGRQLAAATSLDPELGRAWSDGDWTVARGAYFSAVLEEKRVLIEPVAPEDVHRGGTNARGWLRDGWKLSQAHDFGVSAPSVTYVVGESPGLEEPDGRYFPKGSLVLFDEVATHEPGSLTRGMGHTVPRLADEIKELAKRWSIKPEGVADDAIFARTGSGAGSISDEFRSQGVSFSPAHKVDRLTGWEKMRRMLADAGKPDVPSLYVSRACSYWWNTVPVLPRDPRKPDDVDSRAADHAADACRHAIVGRQSAPVAASGTFTTGGGGLAARIDRLSPEEAVRRGYCSRERAVHEGWIKENAS
jgi:hypothetical protein